MDKKWKVIALWVLPITIVILITWQILGSSTNTQVNQTNTSNITSTTSLIRTTSNILTPFDIKVFLLGSELEMGAKHLLNYWKNGTLKSIKTPLRRSLVTS